MTALVIEFVFGLVFVRALIAYLGRRDSLQRDVMFVLATMAALIAVDMYRRLIGTPPDLLSDVVVVLVFAQPYLTLRLVTRLRAVPRWLPRLALVGYAVTVVPLVL